MTIFVGQGLTKSHCLKNVKCQYLIEVLRYWSNFLHVIITFLGLKITFSNIRSHDTPLLISKGWRLALPPGFLTLSKTLGLIGLKQEQQFFSFPAQFSWDLKIFIAPNKHLIFLVRASA